MTMNNEPIEKNRKPAVSDKSKTNVTRSKLAKIHISPKLAGVLNRISEIRARQIAVFPLQKRYTTQIGEPLKQIRERNATRVRELLQVVQEQNQRFESVAISNFSLSEIDSIHFEVPIFNNQFFTGLEVMGEVIDSLLEPVNKIISSGVLESLEERIKKFPENLIEPGGNVTLKQVFEMVKSDGIPLYAVPRMSTVLELVEADNGTNRRDMLIKYKESIFEDCKTILNKVSSEYAQEMRFFILKGLDALENGHAEAAQALFTNTLDTVHQNFWGQESNSRRAVTNHSRDSVVPELIVKMNFWEAFVFYPIWHSHKMYWVNRGDDIPVEYSRHASTHGVSRRQYKIENCIQVLMLVTSLLVYVDKNKQNSDS